MDSRIFIASDHNGKAAKNYIKKFIKMWYGLEDDSCQVVDLGPSEAAGKVDYVDYAENLSRYVLANSDSFGILICGTGTGMCIAANRFPGIRAALVTDRATAELAREHNNANVLVLGQWRNSLGSMDEIVDTFLNTPFGEERHIKRLEKLDKLKL